MSLKKKQNMALLLAVAVFFTVSQLSVFAEEGTETEPVKTDTQTTEQSQKDQTDDVMNLNCKSAILIDANTGTVLYEKNSHESLPPASVTKIMTMLLTMEAIDNGKIKLDDKVTISENASAKKTEGTKLLLEQGEVRTVNELLLGVAIESANDACIALAEHISGSVENFVAEMNKKAKELGMNDTTFKNPNGLHLDGHVTSAYDIALMSRELLKHEKIFDYISKYMTTVYVGKNNDVKRELVNKNKMVRFYEDVDGIKTGFTNEAGFCISLTAQREGLRLISVIMGSPKNTIRNVDARKLIDYGFSKYTNQKVCKAGEPITDLFVKHATVPNVRAVTEHDVSLLMPKSQKTGTIVKKVTLRKNLTAPLKKGDVVGELHISRDGKEVAKVNLVCGEDVNQATVLSNLVKIIHSVF